MNSITKEEYLALINKLLDQQYSDDGEKPETENHWIPAESPLKDKIPFAVQNGVIDLTNAKKDKIKPSLMNAGSFKVDNFLIKVTKRQTQGIVGSNLTLDLEVYEEKFRTPSGNPCRMTYRLDIKNDPRFEQCRCLSNFGGGHYSRNVTSEVFFDLVRWMQALKRMTAFL